jgi:hypothetical protein
MYPEDHGCRLILGYEWYKADFACQFLAHDVHGTIHVSGRLSVSLKDLFCHRINCDRCCSMLVSDHPNDIQKQQASCRSRVPLRSDQEGFEAPIDAFTESAFNTYDRGIDPRTLDVHFVKPVSELLRLRPCKSTNDPGIR